MPRAAAALSSFAVLAALSAVQACSSKGSGAAADSGSDAPFVAQETVGCGTAKLLTVPADPSVAGPWPVGVQTVSIPVYGGAAPEGGTAGEADASEADASEADAGGVGFNLTAEVWYPATIGSESGKTQKTYDLRSWLPPSQQSKIPDSAVQNSFQSGCYADLPIDTTHGPYPAVIFIHGTASFRIASITEATQWASRGFIVVAADHPGLDLEDQLATYGPLFGQPCPGSGIAQDVSRDVDAEIASLTPPSGDLAFLAGSIDMTRIGMAGHSAGAGDAAMFSTKPGVQVDMPLATPNAVSASSTLKSVLIMAGLKDKVIKYTSDTSAYGASPAPKRLVGIPNDGHLVPTDLCYLTNSQGQDLVAVTTQYGVCAVSEVASVLWDCSSAFLDEATANGIMNYATTSALEETLHCQDRASQWAGLTTRFPEVAPDSGMPLQFTHSP